MADSHSEKPYETNVWEYMLYLYAYWMWCHMSNFEELIENFAPILEPFLRLVAFLYMVRKSRVDLSIYTVYNSFSMVTTQVASIQFNWIQNNYCGW